MGINDRISFDNKDKEDFIHLLTLVLEELQTGSSILAWYAATTTMGGRTEVSFRIDEKVQDGTKTPQKGFKRY